MKSTHVKNNRMMGLCLGKRDAEEEMPLMSSPCGCVSGCVGVFLCVRVRGTHVSDPVDIVLVVNLVLPAGLRARRGLSAPTRAALAPEHLVA